MLNFPYFPSQTRSNGLFTRLQSHAAPYSSIAGVEKVIGAERVAPVPHDDVDLRFSVEP